MPRYPYNCPECGEEFDVVKPLAELNRTEICECGAICWRGIAPTNFNGADDWDSTEYCPALGQVVRNNLERRKLAKERGLEEVGNENLTKYNQSLERDRERKIAETYETCAREAYNNFPRIRKGS